MTAAAPKTKGWNRFTGLPRPLAAAVLALLAALMLYGVTSGVGRDHVATAGPTSMHADGLVGDHALYSRILQRVEAGEPYYAAAAAEHRANHYPLKPFVTVRLPTLAVIFAAIGQPASTRLAISIGLAAILAWYLRLANEPDLPGYARVAGLLVAINLLQLMANEWLLIHEVMAGTLIALALALYSPARPWAAMAVIAAALAIRETVLPVAMLFGLFALIDRDWRAVTGWVVLGLCFLAGIVAHISAIAAVTTPADLASPGWNGLGGWPTYVSFARQTSIFRFLPGWASALAVPLALLGWAAWHARVGLAGLGVQLIFAALIMVFARPNNFYWAMLVVPTLYIGLIFAPAALVALFRSLGPAGASVSAAAV